MPSASSRKPLPPSNLPPDNLLTPGLSARVALFLCSGFCPRRSFRHSLRKLLLPLRLLLLLPLLFFLSFPTGNCCSPDQRPAPGVICPNPTPSGRTASPPSESPGALPDRNRAAIPWRGKRTKEPPRPEQAPARRPQGDRVHADRQRPALPSPPREPGWTKP